MKLLSVNCPNCNSRQKFAPHKRVAANGAIETYCNCKMCRTEIIVASGKPRRRRQSVPSVRPSR